MLTGVGTHVGHFVARVDVPTRVATVAVGIHARVNDDDGIFEPFLRVRTGGVDEFVEQLRGGFAACGFVAVDVHRNPNDGNGV